MMFLKQFMKNIVNGFSHKSQVRHKQLHLIDWNTPKFALMCNRKGQSSFAYWIHLNDFNFSHIFHFTWIELYSVFRFKRFQLFKIIFLFFHDFISLFVESPKLRTLFWQNKMIREMKRADFSPFYFFPNNLCYSSH